jgi:hypothetical protein
MPSRVSAPRQQGKRKRNPQYSMTGTRGEGQLDSETDVCALPSGLLNKVQRIAGPEVLAILWKYLRVKRTSPWEHPEGPPLITGQQDSSIEGLLLRSQLQYERATTGPSNTHGPFPEVPWRFYLADVTSLYNRAKSARKQAPRRRKRRKSDRDNGSNPVKRTVNDIFVDFLLPRLQKEGETSTEAKRRFENWTQLGRSCAKLVESFGAGILLLIPQDLSNEKYVIEVTSPYLVALLT